MAELKDPGVRDVEWENAVGRVEDRYNQGDMSQSHPQRLTRVDPVGYGAWLGGDYFFNRQLGKSHEDAINTVLSDINSVVGSTPPPNSNPGTPTGELPPVPTRDEILKGKLTLQGLVVNSIQFGRLPWWSASLPWLTREDRLQIYTQLLGMGEKIAIIQYPDGRPLYDEGGQAYSADRFPALLWTAEQTRDLIREVLGVRDAQGRHFSGVWLFLGGDTSFEESAQQAQHFGPVFTAAGLRDYVVLLPGWDGVWHKPGVNGTGYNPPQIRSFSNIARAAGFKYVGIEQGTGYMIAGEGGQDYIPGGNLSGYDIILGEFDDGAFVTGDVWQILARDLGPAYIPPADQRQHDVVGDPLYPQAHDPHPPFVLGSPNEQGNGYVFRVFEYGLYGAVRGTPATTIAQWRQRFIDMGATDVC